MVLAKCDPRKTHGCKKLCTQPLQNSQQVHRVPMSLKFKTALANMFASLTLGMMIRVIQQNQDWKGNTLLENCVVRVFSIIINIGLPGLPIFEQILILNIFANIQKFGATTFKVPEIPPDFPRVFWRWADHWINHNDNSRSALTVDEKRRMKASQKRTKHDINLTETS